LDEAGEGRHRALKKTRKGREWSDMWDAELFEAALGIKSPWFIERIEFDVEGKKLDVHINFERGSAFPSEREGFPDLYKAKDTKVKTWRHLNFFEHECYLHCRTPRLDLGDGKTEFVSPPWDGLCSGFSILFEALVIEMCANMPVHCVCRIIGEEDRKIWKLLEEYVSSALASQDCSATTSVGMDETSRTKGHNYVSLFVDMDERRTVHVAEGKDHKTVEDFVLSLEARNGDRNRIRQASCDMSPAFIKGVNEFLPQADITFDRFHITKLINGAVDEVRRREVASQPILVKSRYVLLKNEENLTKKEKEKLEELKMPKWNLKSIRALHIRENFQAIYKAETEEEFEALLKKWYYWATHSRLQPIIDVAKTIKEHWDGVVQWKKSQIDNGILEGLNSIVQAAKAKARGYRTFKNFKIVVFLLTGKLEFDKLNPYVGIS
jgi:transposase